MDFRRKLSSGGESFSEGTSRFFSSVMAKKNGLMSDLSNKIESVGASLMKSSSSENSLSDHDRDSPVLPEARVHKKVRSPSESDDKPVASTRKIVVAEVTPIQKSQKNKENVQRAASMDRNQNERSGSRYKRQSSFASTGSSANEEMYAPSGVNMSFDEPLYSPRSKIETSDRPGCGPSWKGKKTPPPIPPPPHNPNKTGRRSSTNSPMLSSGRSSGHSSDSEKYDRNEKYANTTEQINSDDKKKAPSFASTKRRSSTVDEMLFDGYVEPEEPQEKPAELPAVVNKKKTLLPMGDLISFDEPELEDFHPKRIDSDYSDRKVKEHLNARDWNREERGRGTDRQISNDSARSFPSVSSAGSSEPVFDDETAVKGSVDGPVSQVSVESSEPEYERTRRDSLSSQYSLDSQPDDLTLECMSFMKDFVNKIFDPRYKCIC